MAQPRHIVFDLKEQYGSLTDIITGDGSDLWLAGSETPESGGWTRLLMLKNLSKIQLNCFRLKQNDSPLSSY